MTLENNILKTLKKEHITPLPRRYFILKRLFQVVFFLLLVATGVFLSTVFFSDFGENIRYFQLRYILFPIGWILLIALVWVFAFRDLRHIGRFYRYSLVSVIGVLFLLFFLGGVLGYRLGFWQKIQTFFSSTIPGFGGLSFRNTVWTDATSGRLAGIVREKIGTSEILIEDMNGKNWTLELPENTVVEVGSALRFLWTQATPDRFVVSRVLPWFWNGWGKWRMR